MVEVSEKSSTSAGKEFAMIFDEIYNLYGKKVRNLANRLTGNEKMAKEMLSYEQQQHFFEALTQMDMVLSNGLHPGSSSERRSNTKSKGNHIHENEEKKNEKDGGINWIFINNLNFFCFAGQGWRESFSDASLCEIP